MSDVITSRDNRRVKYAVKLAQSGAFRAAEGLFFAEGLRLCLDLAQSLPPVCIYATERALAAWREEAGPLPEVFLVSEGVAEKLAATKTTQGFFALFKMPLPVWNALNTAQGVLLCESLQDPSNVGAVIRTAAGLGFSGVILADASADPFSPRALRAAMGASARLPVFCNISVLEAISHLRAAGAALAAAAAYSAVTPAGLRKAVAGRPFALMVGNEGAGLSGKALAAADMHVGIPLKNGVESLNAAAAAAILMYAVKDTGGQSE